MSYYAITTTYVGPRNGHGAKIRAKWDRSSLTIDYPHHLTAGEEAHAEAAKQLVRKLGRTGTLHAGCLRDGAYVFVWVPSYATSSASYTVE